MIVPALSIGAAGAVAASVAAVPALAAGWYLAPMAARRRDERRLRGRCAETNSLVLTYDDGPGPELTPRLLALLRARDVHATFFLAGFRAVAHPEVADAVVAAGHEVGCHADRHLNAWRTWPWHAAADVRDGYRALARWVPADGMFRPPHGKMTAMTWATVRRRGAAIGWWTVVGGDVEERLPDPNAIVDRVQRSGGGVVLLHDFDRGPERAAFVLDVTTRLLDTAAREGWSVRTLGALHRGEERHAA